jgi:cellulose/xylan binding protein with CBM9 domain/fibronectin type III domain protein
MRLNHWASGPALAGCALIAVTACTTDEPRTEAGLSPTISAATAAASAYDIVKVPSMSIDGNLDDWVNIAAISIADDPANGRGTANNSAKVKLAWDDTYLYAAYDVTDTELLALQTTRDDPDVYKDDAVELFIDPQGDGAGATSMTTTDYQLLANVLETLDDKRGNGTGGKDPSYNAASFLAQAVTNGTLNASGTDVGYAVEMRIAWTDLGVTPSAGNLMRMDLAVDDRDGAAAQQEYFDWANLGSSFNNPSGWKDVQLVNRPAPVSAYDLIKLPAAPTIDGNLSDWTGISAISMADSSGRTGGADNTAKVKLAWDNAYLYAAYDVTDTDLRAAQTTRDASGLYLDDAVELNLDPQGDGWTAPKMTTTDYQFLANIRDAMGDMKGNGTGGKDASYNATSLLSKAIANGTLNATGTDLGYAVELKVAWSDLGVTPAAGNFMRIDPAVDDRDGEPPPSSEQFDWAGLTIFNQPTAWKDVKLTVDATPPAAPTNLALTVVSSSQITVSWTGSTSADVAKYKIYRGTTGTPSWLTTVSATPYQDTSLTAGTAYTYQVSAVDAAGNESPKTAPQSASTGGGSGSGVPFGPMDLYKSSTMPYQLAPFNLTFDYSYPQGIVNQISAARRDGIKLVLQMAGGAHTGYTDANGFVRQKWYDTMDTFNTPAIKQAVDSGVKDGTILFNSIMDEPNHSSWGPNNKPTHATLDSMSRYVKSIFPNLKTGVVVKWDWEKTTPYTSVDVIVSQFGLQTQSLGAQAYRDSAVVSAQRQNVGLMFSMNILDGGTQISGCPVPQTGGPGTGSSTCRMTATQVQDFGDALVSAAYACGLTMWRYDSTFMMNSQNKTALQPVAGTAAGRAAKACSR